MGRITKLGKSIGWSRIALEYDGVSYGCPFFSSICPSLRLLAHTHTKMVSGGSGYIRLKRLDPETLEDHETDCGIDRTPEMAWLVQLTSMAIQSILQPNVFVEPVVLCMMYRSLREFVCSKLSLPEYSKLMMFFPSVDAIVSNTRVPTLAYLAYAPSCSTAVTTTSTQY